FPPAEVEKHPIDEQDGCVLNADADGETDLAIVFGGDGTILTALRACAASGAPVFGFNYGAIGFLSTVERDQLDEGVARALGGDFDVLKMPARALVVAPGGGLAVANASGRDAVDVTTDGRPVGELVPGESVELRFRDDQVSLAQLDGATFHPRFREKFGRLAN